jgi:hypothetical protein
VNLGGWKKRFNQRINPAAPCRDFIACEFIVRMIELLCKRIPRKNKERKKQNHYY